MEGSRPPRAKGPKEAENHPRVSRLTLPVVFLDTRQVDEHNSYPPLTGAGDGKVNAENDYHPTHPRYGLSTGDVRLP